MICCRSIGRVATTRRIHTQIWGNPPTTKAGVSNYLELVDWAGRVVRSGKRGAIPDDLPPILTRLGMNPSELAKFLVNKQDLPRAIGPIEHMRRMAQSLGGHFFKGTAISKWLCPAPA